MYKNNILITLVVGAIASTGLLGCERTDTETQQALREMDEKLDRIEARLNQQRLSEQAARPGANRPERKRLDPERLYAVPVHADDAYRGGEHAKVTIVEAFQFTCPHCVGVGHALHELVDDYKAEELKIVTKHLTGGPGRPAALAACAAQVQGKYSEMEHAIWAAAWTTSDGRPRVKDREAFRAERLVTMAGELGMDTARFEKDMNGAGCKALLARHRREMSALGVTGTPTIFINGRPYLGPRTVEAFSGAIDDEIARVDRELAGGGSIDTYYSGLIAKAKRTR